MWLVLCSPNDEPAIWAYKGLRERGLHETKLVTEELLGLGTRWIHYVGNEEVFFEITLTDGTKIESRKIKGVLNRLIWIPRDYLLYAHPDDQEYANHELLAFFMSWLYALPGPVLNRPSSPGLSGQIRHISEWVWLASKAGLPTQDYVQSSITQKVNFSLQQRVPSINKSLKTIFVVNGQLIGERTPPMISEGSKRLAELSDTELLGIEFVKDSEDQWIFVGASTHPNLRLGGRDLLDSLANTLKKETRL